MRSTPEEFDHLPTVDDESAAVEPPAAPPAQEPQPEPQPEDVEPPASSDPGTKAVSHKRLMMQRPVLGRQALRMPVRPPPPLPASVPGQIAPVAPASPPSFTQKPAFVKNKPTERISLSGVAKAAPPDVPDRPPPSRPVFKAQAPAPPVAIPSVEAVPPADSWKERWDKWGGRSLALSVGIHVFLLIAGTLIVVNQVMDRQVDFLPGGGSVQGAQAEQALQHKIQQKKNPWLKQSMPIRKLAVADSVKNVVLPMDVPDVLDLPQSSKPLGGGSLGGGFGLAGAAGGFGSGVGLGARMAWCLAPCLA